jgi:hypothetical protein
LGTPMGIILISWRLPRFEYTEEATTFFDKGDTTP